MATDKESGLQGRSQFQTRWQDYTPKGPRVAKGTTISGKKTDDRTMELTYKLNGKTTDTYCWELSADGKTLTDTINYPGVDKQEVDVYERQ